MKATFILEIEDDPITLSDGSVIIPIIRRRTSREAMVPRDKFEEQHYRCLPDMTYPISESAYRALPDEVEKVKQEAEAAIAKKKAEEAKAKAEAEAEKNKPKTNPENVNVKKENNVGLGAVAAPNAGNNAPEPGKTVSS